MSAAYNRFARAAQREAFHARVLRPSAPRPEAQLELVFNMASPSWGWKCPYGWKQLAETYAWQRRMAVTRAWAAVRLARMTGFSAWRREARAALADARRLRQLADAARGER